MSLLPLQMLPLVSRELHEVHQQKRFHRLRDQKHQLLLLSQNGFQFVSCQLSNEYFKYYHVEFEFFWENCEKKKLIS
jgi:hypothetical protein